MYQAIEQYDQASGLDSCSRAVPVRHRVGRSLGLLTLLVRKYLAKGYNRKMAGRLALNGDRFLISIMACTHHRSQIIIDKFLCMQTKLIVPTTSSVSPPKQDRWDSCVSECNSRAIYAAPDNLGLVDIVRHIASAYSQYLDTGKGTTISPRKRGSIHS